MTFDFKKYQEQALTTALPSALTMDYLAPGLIAELGEVFGKQAKAVRDGWNTERLNREVCAELGDCLWFLALIGHVTDSELTGFFYCQNMQDAMCSAVLLLDCEPFSYRRYLVRIFRQIAIETEAHGSTLEAAAQANLDKLASRQARGVLGGSGDTR